MCDCLNLAVMLIDANISYMIRSEISHKNITNKTARVDIAFKPEI